MLGDREWAILYFVVRPKNLHSATTEFYEEQESVLAEELIIFVIMTKESCRRGINNFLFRHFSHQQRG